MTDERKRLPHPINACVVAHRVVQAGMLLTLMWKWSFFVWRSAGLRTHPAGGSVLSRLASVGLDGRNRVSGNGRRDRAEPCHSQSLTATSVLAG